MREWAIRRQGEGEFHATLSEVCPILKGLLRVKRARDKAEYMRKWHEQHDLDDEVRDGEVEPRQEETES